MTKSVIASGLLTCMLALIGSAEAFDATGLWDGKYKCLLKAGDVKTKLEEKSSTMYVTQPGGGEELYIEIDGDLFNGHRYNHTKKPQKGTLGAVHCNNDGDAFGSFEEAIYFKVATKPGKTKARMTGKSTIQISDGPGTCVYKYTRVDPNDPGVIDCP